MRRSPDAAPRRGLSPLALAIVSVALGVGAGLGAFGFRVLIAVFREGLCALLAGAARRVYDSSPARESGVDGSSAALRSDVTIAR